MTEIKKKGNNKKELTKPAEPESKNEKANPHSSGKQVTSDNPHAAAKPDAQLAKAGKRSAKALKEAGEKATKEERKSKAPKSEDLKTANKKGPAPIPRPKLERRGKKFRQAAKKIESDKKYELKEAIELAQKTSPVTFDAAVELHVRLNVDPKQADQNIRGSIVLPHGTGKTLRVAVFSPPEEDAKAKRAGADIVGEDTVTELLSKERIDFDVLIAHPKLMSKLARYAKLLGPKGLMPNPKSGTVSANLEKTVKEAKSGRIEYRIDKQGIIHVSIGKVSFQTNQLFENAQVFLQTLYASKPSSIKGALIASSAISTSMGPGIPINPQ